ncbi:3-dehydroquinate synthase [Clostridium sp. 19966]|uniref:3-dehydroquinate synthase n=1 Tax=Clostridium sp. 19966 TaxID=2768166 RepID=UPI0028DD95B1|nr:3-dehydroquinate synthase [Clostridium sp. 19966]MDT8716371.1 3-dehydroquinate synthase [Clostridium sp. 19966]
MITLPINLPGKEYTIFIERDILNSVGNIIKGIVPCKKAVIITDSNVNKLYSKKVLQSLEDSGYECHIIELPAGETSKSIEMLEFIYENLVELNMNRDGILIALGGGVIGDITGFAAATFLRGIKFIQIPTSIIAQVDSSIGGKVAVNLKSGKNLVGNFYHPKAVIIDPNCLNTLPHKFYCDGMAEVIKYSLIKDKDLFNKLSNYKNKDELLANIEDIIYTCCSIKKTIVEKDELDRGDRMLLNFGHTIGHAVEKYFNYNKYTHGEAIAIGMYNITLIGEKLGYSTYGCSIVIKDILKKYELPFELIDVDMEVILDNIKNDKKVFDKGISFIFIKEIENSFIKNLSLDQVRKVFLEV